MVRIVDAHPDDGKQFMVRSDEKLTALLELERLVRMEIRCKNLRQNKAAKAN